MGFLEDLYAERRTLADVLSRYQGIRKIVEEMYPDRAHFIYELLQNAEDTGATATRFDLERGSVRFQHNGKPFTEANVDAITNIGQGSKEQQTDQIGRFGVGFKAVFAYSETPHIWSPTFSFKISELVLPSAISNKPDLNGDTCFEFPFNNPKKPIDDAYAEVEAGLNELAETTLLFLSHISVIQWYVNGQFSGEIRRVEHSDEHVEIVKRTGIKGNEHSHFLRFSEPVHGLEHQRVALAFPLDFLPNTTAFNSSQSIATQLRISASPGRVAVFFPAEKESSGLRFHLHAPFVPELSRASVKDTPANAPLFSQLAGLAARSLYRVRDLELLNADFLAVLPNPQDPIPDRYEPIRSAIVSEMNDHPLTPTYSKTFAPAKYLLQAKASLKELLSPDDIGFLVGYHDQPPEWAIGASQKNSDIDRFLAGLAIRNWDSEQFVRSLVKRSCEEPQFYPERTFGPDAEFMKWLATKSNDWHQHLYAFLLRELGAEQLAKQIKGLKLVRLHNGDYSVGSKCYFPTDGCEDDDVLPRVAKSVYQSGTNKRQQEDAKKCLALAGVREVGEVELVQAMLRKRYAGGDCFAPVLEDIKEFVALFEKDAKHAQLFSNSFIFKRVDEKWSKPSYTFLDAPLCSTGLGAYFAALGSEASKVAISSAYRAVGPTMDKFQRFCKAVGAQTTLEIEKTTISENPQRAYLMSVGGERYTRYIDVDYQIPYLEKVLTNPSLELSRLVWTTMCQLPDDSEYFTAKFQKNDSWGSHEADSQLIHTLRKCAWVPQKDGRFVCPADADRDQLPSGFSFDNGSKWIRKMEFGQGERRRAEANQAKEAATIEAAKKCGFKDKESFERARDFADLPVQEQERILAVAKSKTSTSLPDNEPKNPERRAIRIAERAKQAQPRKSEIRERSVSVGLDDVKKDVQPYLRQQYTNADGVMICQICKEPLPFKLDNGEYYFEKVEFLPELKKWHLENYLALCPNHSAMYQHANSSHPQMLELFEQLNSNYLAIVLAQEEVTIYFTKTHVADLRAVVKVDRSDSSEGE
jgi:hypothetical protein